MTGEARLTFELKQSRVCFGFVFSKLSDWLKENVCNVLQPIRSNVCFVLTYRVQQERIFS